MAKKMPNEVRLAVALGLLLASAHGAYISAVIDRAIIPAFKTPAVKQVVVPEVPPPIKTVSVTMTPKYEAYFYGHVTDPLARLMMVDVAVMQMNAENAKRGVPPVQLTVGSADYELVIDLVPPSSRAIPAVILRLTRPIDRGATG